MHKGPEQKKLVPAGWRWSLLVLPLGITYLGFKGTSCESRSPVMATDPVGQSSAANGADVGTGTNQGKWQEKRFSVHPTEFSEEVEIPGQSKYTGDISAGCVEIKATTEDAFGRTNVSYHKYCLNSKLDLPKQPPSGKMRLAFRSLTGGDVQVYVKWETK
ncbi:MAG: hypothetical protein AAB455_00725 [Patescibacteria group bacterium]